MAKIKKIKLPNDETLYELEGSITDISNTTSNIDSITTDYPDISASDKASTLFGKIKKFLSDLKSKKQDKITGAATTITSSNLTANRVLQSDSNGKVAASGYEFDISTNNTSDTWLLVMRNEKIQHRLSTDLSVKYATSAGSATNANYINVADVRKENRTPKRLDKQAQFIFSNNGMPNSDWWSGIHVAGWNSASGNYNSWELVGPSSTNNDQRTEDLFYRTSYNGTWGSWRRILTSSNYLNYCIRSYAQSGSFNKVGHILEFSGSNNYLGNTSKGNYIWGVSSWSDIRLKKNIKDSRVNALELINKIQMREFDFIDEKFGTHKDIGYVAQELTEVIPECVEEVELPDEDKEKYGVKSMYQVEDKHMIPYLVKAIQEQQRQIEELKAEVERLKDVIES